MTTTEDAGRGGQGWRYRCRGCGLELGIDTTFPEKCPGCGAGGWWGRLTAKSRSVIIPTLPNHAEELCHRTTHRDMHGFGQNNGDCGGLLTPAKPEGTRGPKFKAIPDDLVVELADQGQGAKRIAEVLEGRGIRISARTVHRRLESMRAARGR